MERILKALNHSISETSTVCNCSKDTLRRGIERGEIRTVRFGRRVLIPASEVERIAREGLGSHAVKPTRARSQAARRTEPAGEPAAVGQ